MKLNGKQYDKFILNGKTYEKFYLNNKIYQSLDHGLILHLPLQNNFTDYSASGISMVAGGTSNQPTFALSGRKAGEYCAVFNGSQSIKTNTNLPINSDKVTIAFWMKTTQTPTVVIVELGSNASTDTAFRIFLNVTANKIGITDQVGISYNIGESAVSVNTGNWIHIAFTVDRAQNGTSQNKIYVNGVLSYTVYIAYTDDNNGNYGNYILHIGQNAALASGFVGSMTLQKIWNYPLTETEVTNLYNSEL